VREALQALEKSGLIEIHHGERARVAQPNTNGILDQIGETVLHMLQTAPEMVGHLKQARLMFEVAMVRLAADQPNPEAIGKLEESVRKLEASIGDPLAVIEADMEFHVTIASMSGNPIFEAVTRSMLEWLFVNRRDMLRVPGAEQLTLEEHRRILGAIRSKNGAGANQAMWDHLSRSDKRYQSFDGNA
jgi:DNA-binding FadR family transcriptional regulator